MNLLLKSYVLNTKHIHTTTQNGVVTYSANTSDIKPSFFRNKPLVIYLQDFATNKMSGWELQNPDEEPRISFVYKPQDKYIKKFPQLNGATFTAFGAAMMKPLKRKSQKKIKRGKYRNQGII